MSEHSAWCRATWAMMAEGGTWGIPRSGIIFTKREGKLVLTDAMPYTSEMPMSEKELKEFQDSDFEATREEFGLIGVEVIRDS